MGNLPAGPTPWLPLAAGELAVNDCLPRLGVSLDASGSTHTMLIHRLSAVAPLEVVS